MERGPNDHIGPGAQLEEGEAPIADGPRLSDQLAELQRLTAKALSAEGIARTCHEVNRVYCDANGDFSQKSWNDAPDWQRESALKGVTAALSGVSDEELHALWCDEKHQAGWVYGDIKDADAKTHPCLVPYEQLPAFQQVKDTLFRTIVETLKQYLA